MVSLSTESLLPPGHPMKAGELWDTIQGTRYKGHDTRDTIQGTHPILA